MRNRRTRRDAPMKHRDVVDPQCLGKLGCLLLMDRTLSDEIGAELLALSVVQSADSCWTIGSRLS